MRAEVVQLIQCARVLIGDYVAGQHRLEILHDPQHKLVDGLAIKSVQVHEVSVPVGVVPHERREVPRVKRDYGLQRPLLIQIIVFLNTV